MNTVRCVLVVALGLASVGAVGCTRSEPTKASPARLDSPDKDERLRAIEDKMKKY